MPISVFAADANPTVDRRLYPVSCAVAQDLLTTGRAVEIGKRKIQYVAPVKVAKESGTFNPAPYGEPVGWEQRKSGYVPVMQMSPFLSGRGVTAFKGMPSNGWPERMVFD